MIGTKTEHEAKGRALALGLLVAALMAVMLIAAKPAHAKTFTVNSTGDGANVALDGNCDADPRVFVNVCTLRAAIQEANNRVQNPGADTIMFNIPSTDPNCNATTGVCTIAPASALPSIDDPVTIDGYTQRPCSANAAPCSEPNTSRVGTNAKLLIELSGANAPESGPRGGLRIRASNSVVKGLVINSFPGGGIRTIGSNTQNNITVEGNFIGTDAAGTADLGNLGTGVAIYDSNDTTVGGASLAARNIISGNNWLGVYVRSQGTQVLGNLIGTDRTGTKDLGNAVEGVWLSRSFNTVGGDTAASANVIAFNGGNGGVVIPSADSTGNAILGNSIFSNDDLGIDLGGDVRTPNDVGDGDTGANNLQNFPVITSAETVGATTTTIKARLNSTPFRGFVVRFFSNPSNDNEGKNYIGQTSVTTDSNGDTGTFTFSPEQRVPLGQRITATTTDEWGNTSEFSAPREVTGGVIE